jgi:hypothetical protein
MAETPDISRIVNENAARHDPNMIARIVQENAARHDPDMVARIVQGNASSWNQQRSEICNNPRFRGLDDEVKAIRAGLAEGSGAQLRCEEVPVEQLGRLPRQETPAVPGRAQERGQGGRGAQ